MLKNNKLSIIIVSYNDVAYLERCVFSLYKKLANFSDWEIIIVNNDKKQDIYQLPLDFSRIKVVNQKENLGFGAGVNQGVTKAKGNLLFLLNPDTEIIKIRVRDVFREFKKNPKIGIIGGKIVNRKNKNKKWSAGQEMSLFNLVKNNVGLNIGKKIWNSKEKIDCDWVTGTMLFIEKKLFQQLGGFDENFFMYFEDMDLCKRVRLKGKKVIFYPRLKIFHAGGKSYNNLKMQKKHYYNSLEYYFKKHYNWLSYNMVKIMRKFLRK